MRDVAAVLVCLVQRYGLSVSKLDFYGHGSTHEEVEGTTSHAFRFTFCCLELCAAFRLFLLSGRAFSSTILQGGRFSFLFLCPFRLIRISAKTDNELTVRYRCVLLRCWSFSGLKNTKHSTIILHQLRVLCIVRLQSH